MKRPSFQFYPGDWQRDTALRSCSIAARGLWVDMLCLMHEGVPYGHLKVGSKDILPPILARMVGLSLSELDPLLAELEEAGVFGRTPAGTIFSRRMVRDEEIRQARAAGGFKSTDHPNVPKPIGGKGTRKDTLEGYPSTPSSSGSLHPSPASASASASALHPPLSFEYPANFAGARARLAESVPEDADRDTVLGFVQAIPVPEQPAWVARLMGYLGGLDFPAGLCPTPAQLATACRDYSGPPNPIHFRAYVLRLLKPGRALDGAAGPRRSQSATGQAQLDAGRDWARRKQAEAAVQEATRA